MSDKNDDAATEQAAAPTPALFPCDRDIILGEGSAGHKTNLLLQDLMRLQRIVWKLQDKAIPESTEETAPIAEKLFGLIKNGKPYELAGIKDVPKPFMRSVGRFMEKQGETWNELDDDRAKDALAKAMLAEFKLDDLGDLTASPYKDLKTFMARETPGEPKEGDPLIFPQTKDAILLPCEPDSGREKMFEQQGGNKSMFHLASTLVTVFTTTSDQRVEAALSILKGLEEAEVHEEDKEKGIPVPVPSMQSRFLVRHHVEADGTTKWTVLDGVAAAQFAIIFVFEVFLEKEIHIMVSAAGGLGDIGAGIANIPTADASAKPGTVPIDEPVDSDVLFGRGGMTNSHPGNRRFRDIIALHRPDYIRAIKMDKPGVARKIVKAIRTGDPPGRFLKKGEDGKWYDVGDRTAAEKTSQGLRERSNAEKRQRSALREALRIRKEDMAESDTPEAKKAKTSGSPGASDLGTTIPTLNYIGTNLAVPLSLNMKEHKVKKKEPKDGKTLGSELNTEGLPPNAVDEEGNILVTDYDILCGRGGLTNHHKGNKRFRDIVALHRPDYVRAPKIQKPSVARVIVRAIRQGDPPGRFLRKDEKSGKWLDIGDKKAAEKTSQALREKTNEEREKLKQNPAALGVQVLLPNPTSYLAAVTGAPLILPGVQQPPVAVPVAVFPEGGEEVEAKTEGAEESETKMEGAEEAEAKMEGAEEAEAKIEGTEEAETKMEGAEDAEAKTEGTEDAEAKAEGTEEGETKAEGTEEGEAKAEGTEEGEAKAEGNEEGEAKTAEMEEEVVNEESKEVTDEKAPEADEEGKPAAEEEKTAGAEEEAVPMVEEEDDEIQTMMV